MAMINVPGGPWEKVPLSSDLTVIINSSSFHLHLPFLVLKSKFFAKAAGGEARGERVNEKRLEIDLSHLPGGAAAFCEIANFCYDEEVAICPENVLQLLCAATFLELARKKRVSSGSDFFDMVQAYFEETVFNSWKYSLVVLSSAYIDSTLSPLTEGAISIRDKCQAIVLEHAAQCHNEITLEKCMEATELFQFLAEQPASLLETVLELFRGNDYNFLEVGNVLAQEKDTWVLGNFDYCPEPSVARVDQHGGWMTHESGTSHERVANFKEVLSFLTSTLPLIPRTVSGADGDQVLLPNANYIRVLLRVYGNLNQQSFLLESLTGWLSFCIEKDCAAVGETKMAELKDALVKCDRVEIMDKDERIQVLQEQLVEGRDKEAKVARDFEAQINTLKETAARFEEQIKVLMKEKAMLKEEMERAMEDSQTRLRDSRKMIEATEARVQALQYTVEMLREEKSQLNNTVHAELEIEKKKLNAKVQSLKHQLNLRSKKCVKTLKGHSATVLCMAVDSQNTVYSGGSDYLIKCWKNQSLNCILTGHTSYVYGLVVDENNDLWSGSYDCTIKRWRSGTCVGTLVGHKSPVLSLAFCKVNKMLWSGAKDGSIKGWNEGRCITTIMTNCGVRTLQVTNDGTIWGGGCDGILRAYTNGKCVRILETGANGWICALAVDPSGSEVWAGNHNVHNLIRWHGENKSECEWGENSNGYASALVYHDGFMWSGHSDNKIRIWSGKKCVAVFEGHLNTVWTFVICPDGAVWSGDEDGILKVWSMAS